MVTKSRLHVDQMISRETMGLANPLSEHIWMEAGDDLTVANERVPTSNAR